MLDDPAAFTGRSQIWTVITAYARDHLLLGAGYGSFWGIGDNSPVLSYGTGWLETVYQAHNGYLEMLVNIGLIGLLFGIYDLVLRPLTLLASKPLPVGVSRSMLCAFVTFACLHNLLEGTFMNRAAPTWVIVSLAYASLFKSGAEAARSQREASYRASFRVRPLPRVPCFHDVRTPVSPPSAGRELRRTSIAAQTMAGFKARPLHGRCDRADECVAHTTAALACNAQVADH